MPVAIDVFGVQIAALMAVSFGRGFPGGVHAAMCERGVLCYLHFCSVLALARPLWSILVWAACLKRGMGL